MSIVLELTDAECTRLWARTEFNGTCLLWKGATTGKGGYGTIQIRGVTMMVHRVAYLDVYGSIQNGMLICHHCDTPLCIWPTHLFEGTHLDNTRDMIAKGRLRPRGPGRRLKTLTIQQIKEITTMARGIAMTDTVKEEIINMKEAGFSPGDISKETGVHLQSVYRVLGMNGLEPGDARKAIPTPSEVVEMLGDYAKDMSVGDIVRKYRTNVTTFYAILRESGIETRVEKQKRERTEALEDAITMYVNGSAIHEIHAATGIPPYTMNLELHKRGIQLRRPR